MASICYSISLPPSSKPSTISRPRPLHTFLPNSSSTLSFRSSRIQATTSTSSTAVGDARDPNDGSTSIDNLHRFCDINSGKWNGSFFVSLNFFRLCLISSSYCGCCCYECNQRNFLEKELLFSCRIRALFGFS